MATISPTPKLQFLDANGNPLANGLLYTYASGTTTPLTTYTNQFETTANTNPIVLDARGEASVFLLAGFSYRFVLQNSSGVTQYTTDPFNAFGSMSGQNSSSVLITGGVISGVTINGPINGNVTGNLTGNVVGDLFGNVNGGAIVGTSYNGGQLAGLRNKIINGAMEVAQRGVLFSVVSGATATGYTLDRYTRVASTPAVLDVAQGLDGPASDPTLPFSLRCTVTTADATVAATDLWTVLQKIEGYSARDLIGKTFTLSFWVRSAKTGVHCVSFQNSFASSTDRSYVVEYNVSFANTWEYKEITVIGGLITAGTWDWTNGAGVNVGWALCCGANWQGTPGSWQSAVLYGTASQVNVLDTIGNVFAI
ncbi:MAG: hypothetical protein ACRCWC_12030, partial [Plesiomonas shigelloides]